MGRLAKNMVTRVDQFHERLKVENPIFARARNGELTYENVLAFLKGAGYAVRHTVPTLRLAVNSAERLGDQSLAAHFREKLGEEQGHEVWAERDIKSVLAETLTTNQPGIPTAMQRLMAANMRQVELQPSLYLVYMLFAEHFTVIATPGWFELLRSKCRIDSAKLSVLGNHVALDEHHADEDQAAIDRFLEGKGLDAACLSYLDQVFALYEEFAADVGELKYA